MPEDRAEVIVYDLDGTLVDGDIGHAFIMHLLRASAWRRVLAAIGMPILLPMLNWLPLRRFGVSGFFWIATVGRADLIEAEAREFARRYPIRELAPACAWLRSELAQERAVVVATGALDWLAAEVLARLQLPTAPALVASRCVKLAGGLVCARQCNGQAKVDALIADGFPPPYARAISDTFSDLALLASAEQAVLVNASARASRQLSQKLGDRLHVPAP